MANLVSIFQTLESIGLTDVLLPFILIFSVVFAILQMVKIFGPNGKNINLIVAITMALLVVIPHVTGSYPRGADVVEIMNNSIPNIAGVVIAIVMMMILIGTFGVKFNLEKKPLGGIVALIAVGIVIFVFGTSAGWFDFGMPSWLSNIFSDSDLWSVIVVILVFGIIVWLITHEPEPDEKKRFSMSKFLNDWVGNALEKPPDK